MLKEWEEWMEDRPGRSTRFTRSHHEQCLHLAEEIKRSTQGKLALATQVASAQNLKPLFKQIRSRVSPFSQISHDRAK